MKSTYASLLALLLVGLCSSCNDLDLEKETFPLRGEFYYVCDSHEFLYKDGDMWKELDVSTNPIDGAIVAIGNHSFWFKNGELITTAQYPDWFDVSDLDGYVMPDPPLTTGDYRDELWDAYIQALGKNYGLFSRTSYLYDQATSGITTSEQLLSNEKLGRKYYIEKINREELVLRVVYAENEPYTYPGADGIRIIYKVASTPDESGMNYKVFDTADEYANFTIDCWNKYKK